MSNSHKNYAVPIVDTRNFEEGFIGIGPIGEEIVWTVTDDDGKTRRGAFCCLVRLPTQPTELRKVIRVLRHVNIFLRECRPDAVAVTASWEAVSPLDYAEGPGPGQTRQAEDARDPHATER